MQQLNTPEKLIQATAYGPNTIARLHHVPELVRVLCCKSDRDVPETPMNHLFTNCRHSDRMSSNGLVRVAETCEHRGESAGLHLGRGKQGYAIHKAGTDLRVVRLWHERVELMTVSSILD